MPESKPSIYISTLYLAEGLPYAVVKMMSAVFLKTFGASNEFIGVATNLLTLPWTIKPFWAAFVDIYGKKRNWLLSCQILLSILLALLALACVLSGMHVTAAAVTLFALIAFASATHDIAIDGYYLDVLDIKAQAFFVGVRNTAYKIAILLGSGGLVVLAGKISESYGNQAGWCVSFAACAVILAVLCAFHAYYLPKPEKPPLPESAQAGWSVFPKVFSTYFCQPGIGAIVFYILTFRAGDALMLSMAQPFLLDSHLKGGLGLTTAEVGIIYGTVGTVALLAGGVAGGWLVSRDGLKRWLWPTALIQNSAILLYWLLALIKPQIVWVAAVNAVEQFSYGLGVSAYTVFLLSTVRPDFRASHYAIATGMMALGLLIPGTLSGYLTTSLGYANFFLVSFIAAVPGIVSIFFLPMDRQGARVSD